MGDLELTNESKSYPKSSSTCHQEMMNRFVLDVPYRCHRQARYDNSLAKQLPSWSWKVIYDQKHHGKALYRLFRLCHSQHFFSSRLAAFGAIRPMWASRFKGLREKGLWLRKVARSRREKGALTSWISRARQDDRRCVYKILRKIFNCAQGFP